MLAWSEEDIAKYIETYKSFENKPPDLIKERVDDQYFDKVELAFFFIKKIKKKTFNS